MKRGSVFYLIVEWNPDGPSPEADCTILCCSFPTDDDARFDKDILKFIGRSRSEIAGRASSTWWLKYLLCLLTSFPLSSGRVLWFWEVGVGIGNERPSWVSQERVVGRRDGRGMVNEGGVQRPKWMLCLITEADVCLWHLSYFLVCLRLRQSQPFAYLSPIECLGRFSFSVSTPPTRWKGMVIEKTDHSSKEKHANHTQRERERKRICKVKTKKQEASKWQVVAVVCVSQPRRWSSLAETPSSANFLTSGWDG